MIRAVGTWRNHGKFVSCQVVASEGFVNMGLITDAEKEAIMSAASQSDCGGNK